jgi:hypothetical protein
MITALAQLRAMLAAGDERGAILLAAKWGRLGDARNAVLTAREAILRPAFLVSVGKDPTAAIAAGTAALRARYVDAAP